jgi:uncharacterized protein DUF2569
MSDAPGTAPAPGVSVNDPVGIGGWLILVGLGLVATLIIRAFATLGAVRILTSGTIAIVTGPNSNGYVPGHVGLMRFELVTGLATLAANVAVLILFSRESRWFPRMYMGLLALGAVLGTTDHLLLLHAIHGSSRLLQDRMYDETTTGGARQMEAVGGAIFWICYTAKSPRVKNTFVH